VEHFESSHVQGFLDTLAENDIPWSLTPLYRPDVAELVSDASGISAVGYVECSKCVQPVGYWQQHPMVADATVQARRL
jgi:hypothetical protein